MMDMVLELGVNNLKRDRINSTYEKGSKGQTTVYKTLHR